MSKYHVGDAVRVREDLVDGKLYGNEVFIGDDMMACRGRIAMIKEIVCDGEYYIDIDQEHYVWTEEMFDENFNAPAIEVLPFITSKQVLDSFSNTIKKNNEIDKLTLINQLTDTLINNLDTNTKDMILRYMLLDFFERFVENGNG
jgi:hypothetical protein